MSKTLFQVLNNAGELIGSQCDTLRAAVLEAVRHDGYGAVYERDVNGRMRLYSSSRHIGNNAYFPQPEDAFYESSGLADDTAATDALAAEIAKRGVLHARYQLEIATLLYNDADQLTHVNGESVAQLAADADSTVDAVRRWYENT